MCLLIPNVNTKPDIKSFLTPYFIVICILGYFISAGHFNKLILNLLKRKIISNTNYRISESLLLILLFVWSIIEVISNSYNPFIYYRF